MTTERDEEVLDDEDRDDPNDPRHPDFDLSESAPVYLDEAPEKPWFMRRGVLLVVAMIVIASLILPFIPRL